MVRTYGYNASSRSEEVELFKQSAARRQFQESEASSRKSLDTFSSTYSDSRTSNNESPSEIRTQPTHQNIQNNNHLSNFPPLNQSNVYQTSLHSSMIDPIGSIVGLRLIYVDGQLVYVPVEPHINFLINRQFGSATNVAIPVGHLQDMQSSFPPIQQLQQPLSHQQQQFRDSDDMQLIKQKHNNDGRNNYQDGQDVRNSQAQRQNSPNNKQFGSLPNLAQKPFLSSQEQHKLDLKMQIEENLRRKELEKQKEIELEQKEIRRWEEYQAKIRSEEDREKRMNKEKAMAMERRSQEVYEQQKMESSNKKNVRRQAENQRIPKPQPQYSYEDEEPIRPAQNNRRRSSLAKSVSNYDNYSESDSYAEPKPQQSRRTEDVRLDSAQPREIEWWEKKPTWQERESNRKSAVIPTLRGKPPPVPDSQRSGYDPSASVSEHQSRPTSRATSSATTTHRDSSRETDRSEIAQSRHASAVAKNQRPTAFTISA